MCNLMWYIIPPFSLVSMPFFFCGFNIRVLCEALVTDVLSFILLFMYFDLLFAFGIISYVVLITMYWMLPILFVHVESEGSCDENVSWLYLVCIWVQYTARTFRNPTSHSSVSHASCVKSCESPTWTCKQDAGYNFCILWVKVVYSLSQGNSG